MSSSSLRAKLAGVDGALDALDAELQPLLAPGLAAGLAPLQQAKLAALVPYLANGLLFIYLKTQGVDPKTHPVVQELERVKTYFQKIKDAESAPKRTTAIDQAAAARFITAAVRQATAPQQPAQPAASSSAVPVHVPAKVTDKMRARAEYEAALAEEDPDAEEDEGDELEVFDVDEVAPAPAKGKKKKSESPAPAAPAPAVPAKRRKRTALDVIDGSEPPAPKEPKKKRKKPRPAE